MSTTIERQVADELQRASFERIAQDYEAYFGSPPAIAYRKWLLQTVLKGSALNGKLVLDAMCGSGPMSLVFSELGARVIGVDISETQAALYKARLADCEVQCCSIFDTSFKDQTFDFIFTDSLHHLHPSVSLAMAEFHRLLKPKGKLIIWEPSAGSILNFARSIWYKFDRKYFSENEAAIDLKRLAKDSPQFLLKSETYGGNIAYLLFFMAFAFRLKAMAPNNSPLPNRLTPLLIGIESALMRIQGRLMALWFVAIFERLPPSDEPA